jgi:hypothetical protein
MPRPLFECLVQFARSPIGGDAAEESERQWRAKQARTQMQHYHFNRY